MNSPFNSINTVPETGSIWKPWVFIVLAVFGIAIAISVWNWSRWATSPWWSDRATAGQHFWDILKPPTSLIDPGKLPAGETLHQISQTDSATLLPSDSLHSNEPETWCFVGEDKTGRWCLKVPNSHACDPSRAFDSRSECELVTASAMPLGLLKNGGMEANPLSAIPAMSNSTVV